MMMDKQVNGFFYGLYMDPELLASLGHEPLAAQPAKLTHFALDLHGLAKVLPQEGATVWGMLIKLRQRDLAAMYSLPTTRRYSPQQVEVITLDNETVPAQCYNVPASPDAAFNGEYLDKLLEVVNKVGLPAEYGQHLATLRPATPVA